MAGFVIGGMMNGGNVDQGMAGQVNGGGVAPRVGYNDLTEAIKDQIFEEAKKLLPTEVDMDMHPNMHRILGCAFIDKKRGFGVETEFYANVKLYFEVQDFNFALVDSFVDRVSNHVRYAFLFNDNLHIHLTFTDDTVNDHIMNKLRDWLDTCKDMNDLVRSNRFDGVRIPWKYTAEDKDMFAHIDIESRAEGSGADRAAELGEIFGEFHKAPLRAVGAEDDE